MPHVREFIQLHGTVWALAFPATVVTTFGDYRRWIPRHTPITHALCAELIHDGILLGYGRNANLIVTAGKQQVSDLLIAANTNSFTHSGVGSSTQAPAAGDTALITPQGARVAVTDRYRSGTDAKFDTFYNSAHGSNGTTINETGLFTASAGGILLARSIVSPGIVKTSGNTATLAHSVAW